MTPLKKHNARIAELYWHQCYDNPDHLAGKSFLLGRFLDRGANDNVGTFGSRNRSGDNDHALFTAYLKDAEVLDSDLLITHVTGHAHVFPNTTWSGAVTDGSVSTMHR